MGRHMQAAPSPLSRVAVRTPAAPRWTPARCAGRARRARSLSWSRRRSSSLASPVPRRSRRRAGRRCRPPTSPAPPGRLGSRAGASPARSASRCASAAATVRSPASSASDRASRSAVGRERLAERGGPVAAPDASRRAAASRRHDRGERRLTTGSRHVGPPPRASGSRTRRARAPRGRGTARCRRRARRHPRPRRPPTVAGPMPPSTSRSMSRPVNSIIDATSAIFGSIVSM